jgi:hypothetical protein
MLSIIEYLFCQWQTGLKQEAPNFHQLLYFSLPWNFLKFQHFKKIIFRKFDIFKNNLITAKPETLLWCSFMCSRCIVVPKWLRNENGTQLPNGKIPMQKHFYISHGAVT